MIDCIPIRADSTFGGGTGNFRPGDIPPFARRSFMGRLIAVELFFGGGVGAGTIVLKDDVDDTGGAQQTYLTLGATNTNNWYYPTVALVDNANAARLYAVGGAPVAGQYIVNSPLLLTIGATCTGGQFIICRAFIER